MACLPQSASSRTSAAGFGIRHGFTMDCRVCRGNGYARLRAEFMELLGIDSRLTQKRHNMY
jgi:hypothetical protein